MSLINREALIAEYDRVHVGTPGGARKLIVDAPEVKSEQKWIPCSERMPKVRDDEIKARVLVTTSWGIVKEASFLVDKWEIEDIPYKITAVIAWIPLPEPYKGG